MHIAYRQRPAPPSALVAEVPVRLDALVMSMLDPDPLARPSSTGEVAQRLTAIADLAAAPELEVAVACFASAALVGRAQENAAVNGLTERTTFLAANLFADTGRTIASLGRIDRALIDPPREGAVELVKAFPPKASSEALKRIVYVSCAPGTLARDAAVLVNDRGYRLVAAGVVNMFPHTAHVESIAVFE